MRCVCSFSVSDFMCPSVLEIPHGIATDGASQAHLAFGQLGPLLCFLQLLLGLAEFGQVQSSDLLGLLDLLLVSPDLLLKLGSKLSHPVLVLVVFVLLELQFLDAAL